tara:strand:- start:954 stop:1628 length:675 start_codon:yes stop_codon:yes gene_type:complete
MNNFKKTFALLNDQFKIAGVLLAAGEGKRLGNIPKSLIKLNGRSFLKHNLNAMLEEKFDEIVVVTGFHHEIIESSLKNFPVKILRNFNPEKGQQSSVKIGLKALGVNFNLIIVALADQPLISHFDLKELISEFKKLPPKKYILYPEVNNIRGNPVLLSGRILMEILDKKEFNCRKFIDENQELVKVLKTKNENFVIDIDTFNDIRDFEKRTGFKLNVSDLFKKD